MFRWVLFNAFVLVMLVLDLFVFHRKAHEVRIKEAVLMSIFWISLALGFAFFVYEWHGKQQALEYLAGYLIEKSLSVDNLFVFIVIFGYFKVSPQYQHKILFWGVVGALVMRAIFILTGVALINRFEWIVYVFGAFLIFTGIKMAFQSEEHMDPGKNPVIRLAKRLFPITEHNEGGKFFVRHKGRLMATPFLIVLLVIETTDVVFAMDSIPAILAISKHPFIVYSSNVFAILGLRALYFALAGLMRIFHYLKYGLSAILVFVGAKMAASHYVEVPIGPALGVVGAILALSVLASIAWPQRDDASHPAH